MTPETSMSIDLAKEPPFHIGKLAIDPCRCKISSADGVEQPIEPKLLQVLILLYRKRNTPVSRHELLACCWGRSFVSRDAIERVIGKLRKLEAELAPGSYRISTIQKIGYELVIDEHAPLLTERASVKQEGSLRLLVTAIGARTRIIAASAIMVCLSCWLVETYFGF